MLAAGGTLLLRRCCKESAVDPFAKQPVHCTTPLLPFQCYLHNNSTLLLHVPVNPRRFPPRVGSPTNDVTPTIDYLRLAALHSVEGASEKTYPCTKTFRKVRRTVQSVQREIVANVLDQPDVHQFRNWCIQRLDIHRREAVIMPPIFTLRNRK